MRHPVQTSNCERELTLNIVFFQEFPTLIEGTFLGNRKLLICGDFNFHSENAKNPISSRFVELLENFTN